MSYQSTKRHEGNLMHVTNWKKSLWKGYILYDSNYIAFWKKYSYGIFPNIEYTMLRLNRNVSYRLSVFMTDMILHTTILVHLIFLDRFYYSNGLKSQVMAKEGNWREVAAPSLSEKEYPHSTALPTYLSWKYVSWSLMSQSSLKIDGLLRVTGSGHHDDQGRLSPSTEVRVRMWVRKTEWGLQETQIGCLVCAGHRKTGTETENKIGPALEGWIVRGRRETSGEKGSTQGEMALGLLTGFGFVFRH